jgi:hypothetical protein
MDNIQKCNVCKYVIIFYRSFEFSLIFDTLKEQECYRACEKKMAQEIGEEEKENKNKKETVVMVTKRKEYEDENDNEEQKETMKNNKKETNRTLAYVNLYLYCLKNRHSIKTDFWFMTWV